MDPLRIGTLEFTSRLLVGTGKYKNLGEAKATIEASGAEIITASVRRLNLSDVKESLIDALPPGRYTYLPNTAGCRTAEEALRAMNIARDILGTNFVKLEIVSGEMLLPDEKETLLAAHLLVSEGFSVMAYTTDNLTLAGELEAAGCAAIMPLGAPIGTGLGILHPEKIKAIVKQANVPVLVDAGIGTASDAALAMELGCEGVLLNTAIAEAKDPVKMAVAMKHAVIAGRLAYLAGRMPKRETASPSSPPKD